MSSFSGRCQGILHYTSPIYHCIVDDLVDEIMTETLEKEYNVKIEMESLVSSDDKT